MFTKKLEFQQIGDFAISNSKLRFVMEHSVKIFDLEKSLWLNEIHIDLDFLGVNFFDDFYVLFTAYSQNFIFDYLGKLLCSFENINFYNLKSISHYLAYDIVHKRTVQTFSKFEFYDKIGEHLYYNNNVLIFNHLKTSRILSFSLSEGSELWQYDLSIYGTYIDWRGDERPHEVKAFLGVWQQELLVAVSNARLLAIDIETGVLRHEWHKLAGFDSGEKEKDLMPAAENFILDAQQNCLMGVFDHYYLEINLLNRSIEVVDLAQEFHRLNILTFKKPSNNPFTDTHLFLVCMKNYPPNYTQWSYDCLIALNRQTKQIDWEYAFEEANLGTNIPQYAGDRLYQLDTAGTLHIFEKEE